MKILITGTEENIYSMEEFGKFDAGSYGNPMVTISENESDVRKAYRSLRKGDILVVDPFPTLDQRASVMMSHPAERKKNWRLGLMQETYMDRKAGMVILTAFANDAFFFLGKSGDYLSDDGRCPGVISACSMWPHPHLHEVLEELLKFRGQYPFGKSKESKDFYKGLPVFGTCSSFPIGDVEVYVRSGEFFPLKEMTSAMGVRNGKTASKAVLEIYSCPADTKEEPVPGFGKGHMKVYVPEDRPSHFIYHTLREAGYLAGSASGKYNFVSAAGLDVGGKGVLLLGRGRSGKSTLASAIDCGVLHEDFMLTSGSEMLRITDRFHDRAGYAVCEKKSKKRAMDISTVFVLDRSKDSGWYREIAPDSISPELTYDDELHQSLKAPYIQNTRLGFEAHCYLLGTGTRCQDAAEKLMKLVG